MKKFLKYILNYKIEMACFFTILIYKVVFFLNTSLPVELDSKEYIAINGFDIFSFKLHGDRTPLYPLLIEIFDVVFFRYGRVALCLLQLIIAFISSIYLYKTLLKIRSNKNIALIITFIYSIQIGVTGYEHILLTESFALSLTIFLAYHLISYIKQPNFIRSIYVVVICFLGIFLRPSFLSFWVIACLFFVIYILAEKQSRSISIKSMLVQLPLLVTILIYQCGMYQQNGNFALSNLLIYQQMHVMAITDQYIYSSDEIMVEQIDDAIERSQRDDPNVEARVLAYYAQDKTPYKEFVKDAVKNNPMNYLQGVAKLVVPELTQDFYAYVMLKNRYGIFGCFLIVLFDILRLSITFGAAIIVSMICMAITTFLFLKNKKIPYILAGISCFSGANILTAVLGTNAEFARTSLTMLPFVFMAIYIFVNQIIIKIKEY